MILALCGKSASGKDSIQKVLCEKYGFNRVVSHTTRPKRPNEVDGIDYHFVTEDEFIKMCQNDKLIEWRSYTPKTKNPNDTWYYGTSKEEVEGKINPVCVIELKGLSELQRIYGKENVFAVYIYLDNEVRTTRASCRSGFYLGEWLRRLKTDNNDFTFEDIIYNTDAQVENIDLEKAAKRINQLYLVHKGEIK